MNTLNKACVINPVSRIINHIPNTTDAFIKSIMLNKWFYITLALCLYALHRYTVLSIPKSYFSLVCSFCFILVVGHLVHRISHHVNLSSYYKAHKKSSTPWYVDYIITKCCDFFDFHSVTHHDSSINKQFIYIAYEFINNFLMQGGLLVLFVWFYNAFIDNRVIILWALMYATVHNINYLYMKPTVHRDHHINPNTNYGIDIADIIFGTKFDINDIEEHNHYAINIICITIFIICITHIISWM
jgi:hypothetical protein